MGEAGRKSPPSLRPPPLLSQTFTGWASSWGHLGHRLPSSFLFVSLDNAAPHCSPCAKQCYLLSTEKTKLIQPGRSSLLPAGVRHESHGRSEEHTSFQTPGRTRSSLYPTPSRAVQSPLRQHPKSWPLGPRWPHSHPLLPAAAAGTHLRASAPTSSLRRLPVGPALSSPSDPSKHLPAGVGFMAAPRYHGAPSPSAPSCSVYFHPAEDTFVTLVLFFSTAEFPTSGMRSTTYARKEYAPNGEQSPAASRGELSGVPL